MGASSSRSVPGSISSSPSGLASSEAILASILEPARPTEPLSPVTPLMTVRSRSADRPRGRRVVGDPAGLEVHEGLVEAERLDER